MNNRQFLAEVRRLVSEHSLDARVYSAIACDSCRSDEEYGVVVELTYTYPDQLVSAAQIFKLALRQKSVLLFSRGEVHPAGFKTSKIAMCKMPADSTLRYSALTLHNEQRAYLKRYGVDTEVVVYDNGQDVCLLSVCNLEEQPNFDYWQKRLGGFLRGQGLEPAFCFARVSAC